MLRKRSMRVRSLVISAVICVFGFGCQKDWTDRDLVPTPMSLGEVGKYTISLPSGMKRSSADGLLAIFEGDDGAPYVIVSGSSFPFRESADDYIAGSTDGKDFEKKDVPGGFAVAYENNGPHVHAQRKVGTGYLTCDASMSGGTKDRAKRADRVLAICASMK